MKEISRRDIHQMMKLWQMHNVLKNSGKFIMFSDKKSLFWDLKIKYLLRVSEFLNHT